MVNILTGIQLKTCVNDGGNPVILEKYLYEQLIVLRINSSIDEMFKDPGLVGLNQRGFKV